MKKKLKILICGDSVGIGGAETHILALSSALTKMGHDVTVAARNTAFRVTEMPQLKFVEIDTGSIRGGCQLRGLIKDGKFDIVHAHSRWTAFAVNAARNSLTHPRFGFAVTAHALYSENPFKDGFSVWGDGCIAVSRDIERMLKRRFSLLGSKVTYIPNGIDTDIFVPASTSDGHKLLFASRLDSDCSLGAELLCRLIPRLDRHLPGVTLTIAGGGDRYGEIRKTARRVNRLLGRNAIRALGAVTDVASLIANCDCAIGVSRFALEAAAMKKNVILFGNEGGLGLLCPECWQRAARANFTARGEGVKDEKFLEREILSFFALPHEKRLFYAEFCRQKVVSEHSSEVMAARTLEVYRKLLRPPTVLIGGYYGFGNLGDETVKGVLVNDLRPHVRVMVLTARPRLSGDVDRGSLPEIVRAMKKADVYVSGGGSLFQDSTSFRSLAYYCALISLARMMGCRVAAVGNGIGPLRRRVSRAMARAALCKCGFISVRDALSQREVTRLTCGRLHARLSADPAFSADLPVSGGGDKIAVSLKSSSEFELDAIKMITSRPFPIAMDASRDMGVIPENFQTCGELMKSCGGAVGERFHFLIMAFLCRVPFAPLGTDPKIAAFSEMVLSLPPIDPKDLDSAVSLSREIEKYLERCRKFYESGGRERLLSVLRCSYGRDILDFIDFASSYE